MARLATDYNLRGCHSLGIYTAISRSLLPRSDVENDRAQMWKMTVPPRRWLARQPRADRAPRRRLDERPLGRRSPGR